MKCGNMLYLEHADQECQCMDCGYCDDPCDRCDGPVEGCEPPAIDEDGQRE